METTTIADLVGVTLGGMLGFMVGYATMFIRMNRGAREMRDVIDRQRKELSDARTEINFARRLLAESVGATSLMQMEELKKKSANGGENKE